MTIPFQELPGAVGPKENSFGLDEMTRYFQGDASAWSAFRATILPGTADPEFSGLKVSEISPERLEGDLVKATVSYSGLRDGGDGSGKTPQKRFSRQLKSATSSITLTRTHEFATLQNPDGSYGNWMPITETQEGSVSYSFYAPSVTYRYCRNASVTAPQYAATATTDIGALDIEPFNRVMSLANGASWGLLGENTRNVQLTDSGLSTGTKTTRNTDLTCDQRGAWFEIEETWEVVYV